MFNEPLSLQDIDTVYVVIFEWLNFRKYGKIKVSKKYFRIFWYAAVFEIFSSGIRLLGGGFEFARGPWCRWCGGILLEFSCTWTSYLVYMVRSFILSARLVMYMIVRCFCNHRLYTACNQA